MKRTTDHRTPTLGGSEEVSVFSLSRFSTCGLIAGSCRPGSSIERT